MLESFSAVAFLQFARVPQSIPACVSAKAELRSGSGGGFVMELGDKLYFHSGNLWPGIGRCQLGSV